MKLLFKKTKEISEDTKFTLAVVALIVGAVSYVTMLQASVTSNHDDVVALKSQTKMVEDRQAEMAGDIKVIRAILEHTTVKSAH